MRILVLPRDPNPYQDLLYAEMRRLGVRITYLGELTPSHTLNVLLLPLEVGVRRLAGARLVHLHWVFVFAWPGAKRFRFVRRLGQIWFLAWLRACKLSGIRIVWTAHNVLPHEQVFADDVSARHALVRASDLVIAHSPSALAGLAALGMTPHASAIIGHGPIAVAESAPAGVGIGPRRFLFFGQVKAYKGVEELLLAFAALPDDVTARLTVAGQCQDPALASRLQELATRCGGRVALRLERVPDHDVAPLLADADVVVLPFRQVTTSGSAMLALTAGRPLIVPDLPGLADLPDRAVLRYAGTVPELSGALARLARADGDVLAAMCAAAREYATATSWRAIAEQTVTAILAATRDTRAADASSDPIAAR